MISCWTGTYSINPKIYTPANENDLKQIIKKKNIICYGNGRSYGDNCLNTKNIISMKKFNKIKYFNKESGIIEVESGVILNDILDEVLKYNWFFPTSPGTKFVTIGGLVANNVHGKNINSKNFFYDYINSFLLFLPNGEKKFCSKKNNKFLFDLTVGGMGLTGIILTINFSLKKILGTEVKTKKVFNTNLNFLKNINKEIKNKNWEYGVIWLDSFRYNNNINSIIFFAKHIKRSSKEKIIIGKNLTFIHFLFFSFFNNFWLYRIINLFYFFFNKFFFSRTKHILNYFYQIDKFKNINKIYGKDGFIEFQFIISRQNIFEFLFEFYKFSEVNKIFSNLIVIKIINQKSHYLSFHGKGFSISMDFKLNKININKIKDFFFTAGKKYNLNFNLAKDLILNKEYFNNNKNYKIFKKNMSLINNNYKFKSVQSNRLGLTSEK